MGTVYIRYSSKPVCDCGSTKAHYSLIQDKKVRATICEECYKPYSKNLRGFKKVFLTFNKLPNLLPKFLRRIEDESKAT